MENNFPKLYPELMALTDREFLVNTYVPKDQTDPEIVPLIDGGFLITWIGAGLSSGGVENTGIFAQRYNSGGDKIGSQFQLSDASFATTGSFSGDSFYSVAPNVDGGWLVAYTATDGSTRVDRFNSQGQETYLSGATSGTRTPNDVSYGTARPQILTLNDGSWLYFHVSSGNILDCYWYDSVGKRIYPGGNLGLNIGATGNQQYYAVTKLGDGGWVVAVQDGLQIEFYRFYSDGRQWDGSKYTYNFVSPAVVSSIGVGGFNQLAVTGLKDGGWIITWDAANSSNFGYTDIYAQRYSSNGTKVGDVFLVNTYITSDQKDPSVVAMPDGGWVIAWKSFGQDGDSWGVYAKRYNSSGQVTKSEFKINQTNVGYQSDVDLAILNNGTLVASWTSSQGDNGSTPSLGVYASVILGNAPTVSASQSVITVEDTAKTITVTGADVDGDTLTYSAGSASNGTVTGGAGGVFTYTPNSNYAGTDSFVVSVSDGRGGATTQTVSVIITPVEDEVTGVLVVNGTAQEGGSLTASLEGASDPDGAFTLAYQWQISDNRTVWTNIIGATSATYNLAQDQSQIGKFLRVVVTTTDVLGGTTSFTGTSSAAISNVNDAPIVAASQEVSTSEDTPKTISVLGSDPDGDPLVITAVSASNGTLTGGTMGVFTYTPNANYVGTDSFIVTLSDGKGGEASQTVNVTVIAVEDEATGALDVTGTAEEGGSLTASLTGAVDPDGAITSTAYQWQISSDGSNWTNISGATAATYNLASDQSQVGKYVRVVVTTTDALGGTTTFTGSTSAAIANVNDAPTVANAVADQNASEDSAFGFQFAANSFADEDGDSLTFSAGLTGGGTLPAWLSFDAATRTFSGTPANGDVGTVNVTVTADDGNGGTVSESFAIIVVNVNDTPEGFLVDVSGAAVEDQVLTASASIVSDADGVSNPVAFSYQWQRSSDGFTWVNISGATGSTYVLSDGDVGLRFRVISSYTDNNNTVESAISSATNIVENINDVPIIVNAIVDQNATEDSTFSFQFASGTFVDADSDRLTYSAQLKGGGALPSWLSFDSVTRTFSGTPRNGDVGIVNVTLTADDGNGGTVSDSFAILVANSDDLATGTLSVTGTAEEGGSLSASLSGASDPDGAITGTAYQWQISTDGTTWSNIAGATSATYNLASDQSQVGKFVRVVVTTTDALGGTTTFTGDSSAAIANVNDSPVGGVTLSGQANERQTLSAVTAGLSDPDGLGSFSYQWQSSTDGVLWSALSSATGSTYTLTTADIGNQVRVVVSYTDAFGAAETVTSSPSAVVAELVVNEVTGTSGADTLTGVAGVVNVYTGGAGNDSITGKDRADVAVFTGNRSDYTVTTVAGVITVVDNRPGSPDGTDTIRGMNILRFADSQLFVTAAANRTTLAGVAQTFEVANSEFVTGTAAAERFIIQSGVSAFVSAGTGDTVDLSGAITDYTYKASGNQLQISDGVNTTVLTVGGAFTLRTASGSTPVVLDFAAGGVIKLGAQVVGSAGFDPAAAITNAGNTSAGAQGVSTTPPTVTALTGSSDTAPTITGTAVLGDGQTLEVTVNGTTYTTATGVVLGAGNTWSLTLPSALPAGTYEVQAVLVRAIDAVNAVTGTSGADTLTGMSGVVNVYTGGGGNDSITGKDRADVAVFTGNRSDYTVTTVAGVVTVVDNRPGSPDGTDTLRGMNILRFADSQLFVTAAANRTTLAGVAQTFEVANSEFVTGTAAAERFIIQSGVSAFVSAGTGDMVDLSGAITDYTYKASGNQLQISDGVNTTVLTVGGAFTLRTASGSTPVVLDFAAGGVIKLGAQVVGSAGFDPAAAITNAGNVSDNAIPEAVTDTSSNELVINDPVVVVSNGGTYTAMAGKVDTFVVDANSAITATISGFEPGDIIEIQNSSDEIGVSFDNFTFGDSSATVFISASVTINLTNLASDSFGDEASFEAIYGSEAITYAPALSGLSLTSGALVEFEVGTRETPSTLPIKDGDQLPKLAVIAMPVQDELERLLGAGIGESIQNPGSGPSYGGFPALAEEPFARQIMDVEWPAYPVLPQEAHVALVI